MSEPEIFTPEQVAALRNWLSKVGLIERDEALRLCATVKAQAEVIQRYKDGWHPMATTVTDGVKREWWRADDEREPMPEAHQTVVYGARVAPRSEP